MHPFVGATIRRARVAHGDDGDDDDGDDDGDGDARGRAVHARRDVTRGLTFAWNRIDT
jgi:hypothetical protein